MHQAKFSPQVCGLSQLLSSLLHDGWQSKEILFETFPAGKLFGERFRTDFGFEGTDMAYDFKIIRISGHVIWKYQPSSDVNAKPANLKLKRLRSSVTEETVFGELRLVEYDDTCTPDDNGFIKQSFDLHADSQMFWQEGDKGTFAKYHAALANFRQLVHTHISRSKRALILLCREGRRRT